jgi:Flp pilus assembly protein TadG
MAVTSRSKIGARALRLITRRIARRFVRRQDGAAAVEFALVATPFLALTFAILETALVFFASQTLEAAASDSSRLIMTGQAQLANYTKADFKNQVCARIYGLFDCVNKLQVDVKTFTSFSAVSPTAPVTDGNLDSAKTSYEPGDVGNIVAVTLYYQWPIYVSLLGNNLSSSSMSAGYRLLAATAVFRNEPFK